SIRLEPTKTLQGSHVGSTKPSLRPCKRGSIETGENAPSPPDRRASIRYDKVVDGIDALPDENTQARRYRNGATRSGLQHEKGNQHSGRWWFDGGNPGIGSASRVPSRAGLNFHVFTQPGPLASGCSAPRLGLPLLPRVV